MGKSGKESKQQRQRKLSFRAQIHVSKRGLFNGNVNFNIKVTDPIVNDTYSGINKVSYRIYKDGKSKGVDYISLYNKKQEETPDE